MVAPPDPARRRLLGGTAAAAVRPPWTSAARIGAACTGCGACIAACPEGILTANEDQFLILDPRRGLCTFCGDCAAACTHGVFDPALNPAQPLRPAVSTACLEAKGIVCEICRDACPEGAIRIVRRAGRTAHPWIDDARCTGCGGCVAPCPAGAVALGGREPAHAG